MENKTPFIAIAPGLAPPQDDIMFRGLTVLETFVLYASLRLPPEMRPAMDETIADVQYESAQANQAKREGLPNVHSWTLRIRQGLRLSSSWRLQVLPLCEMQGWQGVQVCAPPQGRQGRPGGQGEG